MVCYPCRPNTGELISFWTDHLCARELSLENNQNNIEQRSLGLTCDTWRYHRRPAGSRPSSRGLGVEFHGFAPSRRVRRPSFVQRSPSTHEGAGKTRHRLIPAAPVRKGMHGAGTTGSAGLPGLPCAMVLRLLRTLPGDRRSCPRLRRRAKGTPRRHQRRDARTMRLDRPCGRRSSVGACPSITSHPNAPDDAQRPSSMRRDSDRGTRIPIKRKIKICAGRRDRTDVIEAIGEIRVSTQDGCGPSPRPGAPGDPMSGPTGDSVERLRTRPSRASDGAAAAAAG